MSNNDKKLPTMNPMDKNGANASPKSNTTWVQKRLVEELKDLSSAQLWRGVLGEFLGTMMLCLWTIGLGLRTKEDGPPDLLTAAIGTALGVAAIIASLVRVSGGHVNPAVSLGFLLCGQITCVRFVFYSAVQCMSSVAAVWIIRVVYPSDMHGSLGYIGPGPGATPHQVFAGEFMIGFLLVFGVVCYIDDARSDLQGLVPMYVGFIVVANILFAAGISGGCMNPARNFGPSIMTGNTELLWAYILGPMLGSLIASLIFIVVLSGKVGLGPRCCSRSKPSSRNAKDGGKEAEAECMIQENDE